jgi:hypothetical protein
MSQQGPLLIISNAGRPPFAAALDEARMFPIIEVGFAEAMRAVSQMQPSAILVDMRGADQAQFAVFASRIAARKPYLPLIAIQPEGALVENAIPFAPIDGKFDSLLARLRAALRVRALHVTVLRRLGEGSAAQLPEVDPVRDATVLLIGRGGAYPALSVALGESMGVVGSTTATSTASCSAKVLRRG